MEMKAWKVLGLLGLLTSIGLGNPAKTYGAEIAVETSTALFAKTDRSAAVFDQAGTDGTVLSKVEEGKTYEVLEAPKDGWLKIQVSESQGYIKSSSATLIEKSVEKVDKSVLKRQEVVDYALQFVGGRYVYGGANPNSGVDCSGFTRYVLGKSAGVSVSHSSRSQSVEGQTISYQQARPGDLVFYGKNGRINHVALYMGNGQVVHASTEKTGIIVTNVMYRKPVKFVSVLN